MSLASESADLAQPLRAEFAHAQPSMAGVEDYLALLKPRRHVFFVETLWGERQAIYEGRPAWIDATRAT